MIHLGFVYFVTDTSGEGPVKIGYSDAPQKRLRQLQTGYPKPLMMIVAAEGTPEVERAVHSHCAASRMHGEWFERSPCVIEAVELARAGRLNSLVERQAVTLRKPRRLPISIRLSKDVLARFRATGKGWQARIDEALRKANP